MKRWFHPAFEVELIEAARYLEQQRSDFSRQFIDEAEASIERIMQAPATWRPRQRGHPALRSRPISMHNPLPCSSRRRIGGIPERNPHRAPSRRRVESVKVSNRRHALPQPGFTRIRDTFHLAAPRDARALRSRRYLLFALAHFIANSPSFTLNFTSLPSLTSSLIRARASFVSIWRCRKRFKGRAPKTGS